MYAHVCNFFTKNVAINKNICIMEKACLKSTRYITPKNFRKKCEKVIDTHI